MCAIVQTPLGPEASLVAQQQSPSRRNAVVVATMEEEFGRWAQIWALPPMPEMPRDRPARTGNLRSFWGRLLGRGEWRLSPRATSARSGRPDCMATEGSSARRPS